MRALSVKVRADPAAVVALLEKAILPLLTVTRDAPTFTVEFPSESVWLVMVLADP